MLCGGFWGTDSGAFCDGSFGADSGRAAIGTLCGGLSGALCGVAVIGNRPMALLAMRFVVLVVRYMIRFVVHFVAVSTVRFAVFVINSIARFIGHFVIFMVRFYVFASWLLACFFVRCYWW